MDEGLEGWTDGWMMLCVLRLTGRVHGWTNGYVLMDGWRDVWLHEQLVRKGINEKRVFE